MAAGATQSKRQKPKWCSIPQVLGLKTHPKPGNYMTKKPAASFCFLHSSLIGNYSKKSNKNSYMFLSLTVYPS